MRDVKREIDIQQDVADKSNFFVKIKQVFEREGKGIIYIVMEHFEASTLFSKDFWKKRSESKILAQEEALSIFKQLISSIAFRRVYINVSSFNRVHSQRCEARESPNNRVRLPQTN